MAMERVERRLKTVTAALDAAGIRYAVIGGNAVACWVAKADPAATRTTKDVDLLVDPADIDRISEVMAGLGFVKHDLRRLVLFVDPAEPSKQSGVHLVWCGRKVRPSYAHAAPSLDEVVREPEGYWVLNLPALLRMKLTSLRKIDQAHVEDLLRVGMIDASVESGLPVDLRQRLRTIESEMEREDE